MSDFSPIFLKLPPDNIVALKFILESYEGIGILRPLDPATGEGVGLSLEDTKDTVLAVVESVAKDLDLRIIPKPQSVEGDWLFSSLE